MNNGTFAFLDCLGFKGVWNRGVAPDLIVGFLERAQEDADNLPMSKMAKARLPNIDHSIVFISDTVAVSNVFKTPPPDPELGIGYLVDLTAQLAILLAQTFATAPMPLVFRGAITCGPHIAKKSFVLGPAVDLAAELAPASQGAFVWLHPQASAAAQKWRSFWARKYLREIAALSKEQRVAAVDTTWESLIDYSPTLSAIEMQRIIEWWRRLSEKQKQDVAELVLATAWMPTRDDSIVTDYPVEMKNGAPLICDVVNPLFPVPPEEHDAWIEAVLSPFGSSSLDIIAKRQNTARFLYAASRLTAEAVAVTRKQVARAQEEAVRITGVPF